MTLKQARDTLVELKRQKQSFEDDLPTLMVMEETPQPRPTFLLKRGAYDAPGEKVERGSRIVTAVAVRRPRESDAHCADVKSSRFCPMVSQRGAS